ncbi:DUF3303 domain-containing protein [Candidatus Zixiibacteriota bacterium]
MMYLCIFTFDSSKREAVLKRRALGGEKAPKGLRVLMELVDLTQNRAFRLCEAEDPSEIMIANEAWSDLGKIETIPVVESDDILQKLSRMKKDEIDTES